MTDLSKIKAEMGHYSSVVGNSVHLIAEDGRMIGQIAILCHTDDLRGKDVQAVLCERIVQAFDPDALIRAGIEEGLRMGADKAEHRWREWGNLAPHEKVECDVTACEDIARSILSTSPEVISAAVARVKGGE